MSSYLTPLLVAILCTELLIAQTITPAEKLDLPPPEISIIALGPIPMRRYEILGHEQAEQSTYDQAILLKAPRYAVPPAQLFYKKGGGKKWARFAISFNNQAALTKIPSLKKIKFFPKVPTEKGGNPTLDLPPMKPSTKTLLFLTPVGKANTLWKNEPKLTPVPLTWLSNGGTRLLLVNLSKQVAQIRLSNGKQLSLKPGSRASIDLTTPANANRIILKVKGVKDSKFAIQDSIKVASGITKVYAFYNASPKTNGGRTLGTFRAVYDAPKPKITMNRGLRD